MCVYCVPYSCVTYFLYTLQSIYNRYNVFIEYQGRNTERTYYTCRTVNAYPIEVGYLTDLGLITPT